MENDQIIWIKQQQHDDSWRYWSKSVHQLNDDEYFMLEEHSTSRALFILKSHYNNILNRGFRLINRYRWELCSEEERLWINIK